MPFPVINHCLICEDVRVEAGQKASVLGFYGLAPNVQISVLDFKKPLAKLCFLFLCAEGEGQFQVSLHIASDKGQLIFEGPEAEVVIESSKSRFNLILGVSPVYLSGPGVVQVSVLIDGKKHYETSFETLQGKREDFLR